MSLQDLQKFAVFLWATGGHGWQTFGVNQCSSRVPQRLQHRRVWESIAVCFTASPGDDQRPPVSGFQSGVLAGQEFLQSCRSLEVSHCQTATVSGGKLAVYHSIPKWFGLHLWSINPNGHPGFWHKENQSKKKHSLDCVICFSCTCVCSSPSLFQAGIGDKVAALMM